jgi:hypothetical protein
MTYQIGTPSNEAIPDLPAREPDNALATRLRDASQCRYCVALQPIEMSVIWVALAHWQMGADPVTE